MSSYRHKSFVSSKKRKINCKTFDSPAKRRFKRIVPVLPTESNKILPRHLN